MSGRGGFRGGGRGGGGPPRGRGGGGFRGGRGGFGGGFDNGPPAEVLEMGSFVHAVEGEMLCSSTNGSKVPYFNAPIYLANKTTIGKVDEILGPINEVYFTIKMSEGMVASSFNSGDKVFIAGDKLLPIERFLPKPPGEKVPKRGGGGRGGRGAGRGAPRGGRGAPRGGGRGFSRGGGAGGARGSFRGTPRGGSGGGGFRGGGGSGFRGAGGRGGGGGRGRGY
ncbi:hypothetical protein MJO28_000743 [Puccinia striiformis f. sp. tritici]|uniref:H/ACA ribonucleoprotein complex subunit n=2 Tax=Puccinia striiformis f. sp. tritici TaxID=168172 RepID=A0A0L0V2B1_9BASI|nr:hypothetical protein Pst134EA_000494 [Puccinia striiformis f. sp. tritici]KAI9607086.1 hypothetical protein KEM48_001578 [Puccinia striiformis f. sp. tritici PST-130]KNE93427.1 hypothetical protein PSTG_13249 [Puccinia striiformis f. sp. tritici PST-78]KAH9466641.1 hypothetical protein Pst134EB_001689 [Puccinia striiformis f. sp. tritici]KAH9473423.1 hypothetical protein Pst134EA_000494 [Puccinia striiformis f. sp. tritici]KAI7962649.1 hypothetical protein MJO28_000743 [Puccinia striiformis